MKILRFASLILLLLTSVFFAFNTYKLDQRKVELKTELIEISKIKYGLFNVDEWKLILAEIITKKVEAFNLDGTNREEMHRKISNFLTVAIHDLEARYYDEKTSSFLGILQGGVAAATGIFGKIKDDIPVFTEQILDFMNDAENREAIRTYLIQKLNEYADETFAATEYSTVTNILRKYDQGSIDSTKNYLELIIQQLESESSIHKILLVFIAIASLAIIALLRKISNNELIIGLFISLVFLTLGILLPMIEIDARISEMTFHLLGEKVEFSNQVLYYESKSILEVVHLMMIQNRIDLIAVGILVLTFSVLFPFSKLICSGIYLQNTTSRTNPVISFIVFKSGKWSMADVMVIAIFMAYIGFDGIITEQLKQLESLTNNLDLFTTNKSNLLFGFYAFAIFVLMSLTTSQKIQMSTPKPTIHQAK